MEQGAGRGAAAARRLVLRLAWPLASLMLGETLMGLVDTKLVGGLGASALAGVGLANAALYLVTISVVGLMRSVKVCTSHSLGEGKPHVSYRYAVVGMAMGFGLGACFALALQHLAPVMLMCGIPPDLVIPTTAYLEARAWGMPAVCALAALMEHRQGLGEVRTSLWVGLLGNALNAALAFVLIEGHLGAPALGVQGAGLGTLCAEWCQLLGMLSVMWMERQYVLRQLLRTADLVAAARELLTVGLPVAVHFALEYLAFASVTGILAQMGEVEVAAHQIAVVINRLAYLPCLAIGEVACILVSSALGAKQLNDAELGMRAARTTAVGYMTVCGLLLASGGRQLAELFTNDPAIVERAAEALMVAGIFGVLDAINIVLRGALRGARDVRWSAYVGIGVLWTTVPTVTWALGRAAGWGVLGGWCSFVVETAICATIYALRWRYGSWRRAYTQSGDPSAAGAPMAAMG